MSDRKHWFSYCFQESGGTRIVTASAYIGYPESAITKERIEVAKDGAGVSVNAVLLNVSYLGHMTRSQFLGESPLPQEQTNE
jgi:hypothetical protein